MQDTFLDTKIAETTITPKVKKALEKAGILTVADITKKTQPEIKKIKGLGQIGFAELTLFISQNKLKLAKGKQDTLAPKKKFLMDRFLKDPKGCNKNQEFSVAGKLLARYPDETFWEKFNITFKLNSLCFFLSQKGRELVDKAYYQPKTENKIQQKEEVKLSTVKVGEDIVSVKPKSIQDFLND
jgi:hypothetical protein